MCKLLKKILNLRSWYLELKILLNANQYDLRRRSLYLDVLTNVEFNIYDTFLNGEYLAALCLYIEKCSILTQIWRSKIASSLLELKMNGNMLSFITNFLLNRSIQVRVNGVLSYPVTIQNGVSQG